MNVRIYPRTRGGPWWVAYKSGSGKYLRRSLGTRDHAEAEAKGYSLALGSASGKVLIGDDATVEAYPGLTDPLAGLKRLRQPRREARFLTPDEVRKLLGARGREASGICLGHKASGRRFLYADCT